MYISIILLTPLVVLSLLCAANLARKIYLWIDEVNLVRSGFWDLKSTVRGISDAQFHLRTDILNLSIKPALKKEGRRG